MTLGIPTVSVQYAHNGSSTKANELGMRPMQERVYEKRGEQYLLIKSPPASGKSRALMFVALDKLHNQGLRQAIIVVPEKSIGASSVSYTHLDVYKRQHEHPQQPDGIVYPSRLNGETNLAIYGRAIGNLELLREQDLKRAAGLPNVLDDFFVALL